MIKQNSELTYREIYHQPESFQAINDTLPEIYQTLDQVFFSGEAYDQLIFTGCGTSLYLAQAAACAFSSYTGIPAKGVPCSELLFFPEACLCGKKTLVLPVTRKSYTTEVRMAIDKIRTFPNVKTLAITCDGDSRLYNDFVILSPDAEEKSVIMTGSFTSMVYLCTILALYVGKRGQELAALADYRTVSQKILEDSDAVAKKVLAEHTNLNLFITLGQGVCYGIAEECMNKMKEMGIANSEAYYSMEYRHGPMSLVDENTLIVLLSHSQTVETDRKLLEQMKTFGAVVVAVGENAAANFPCADYTVSLTAGLNDVQNAASMGFIGQTLGYHLSVNKGIDADAPRHLSQAIVL